jgi:hypothetical protein
VRAAAVEQHGTVEVLVQAVLVAAVLALKA